jgi:spore germination protein KC
VSRLKNSQWIGTVKILVVLALIVPMLTGCWDRLEIEERAVVLGVGIDEAPPESAMEEAQVSHLKGFAPVPGKRMVRISVQLAVPGRIPLGPGEGGGGGNSAKSVWVIEVVGHTIDDAMSNLQQQLSAPLFFGHLRIIVISESFAKKGLQNVNDYFHRNPEIRRTTWMVISEGKASAFMRATPELERVPSLYLQATMDQAVRMGKLPNVFIGIFWSAISKKGQDAYVPYVQLKKKKNVEIAGLAYFKGDKMVGTTKPLQIAMLMEIKNMNPAGYQTFAEVEGKGLAVYTATHRKSKINVYIDNGKPHFTVKIAIEGNIREKTDDGFRIDPDTIRRIERQTAEFAVKGNRQLIRETQEKGADIFGFGEIVRAFKPFYWNKHIRTKSKWEEMYKDIAVEVTVEVHTRRIGMKAT